MENAVLEPRAERIARYKAERRRELAERFGTHLEELPSKWVRRDGNEEPEIHSHGGGSERVNGRARGVANGLEADAAVEPSYLRRQGSASVQSGEGHPNAPQLHTRVSVGQLRSALLQQSGSGEQPDKAGPDGGRATSSLDLAVKPGPEGNRRRTRRYLPGAAGGGRKNSERFRTQPITANEMEESSGLLDADDEENSKADVKTDERSKMSVAAKMSLFKELEKSAAPEASAFLKPRSGSVCHERRVRRGNEHRFLTQPITCEEMVAVSAPKAAPPVEAEPVEAEPAEDGDENCKLSMSEKLALFNKLALPEKQQDAPQADAPPERRRQKGARYRTQPITVEEVSLLQKGPVQLPTFCLSAHLSDRQQASNLNLKPSELRLSQSRPDISPAAAAAAAEPGPAQQGMHRCESEPGLRGILKRSRTDAQPSLQYNGGTQERTDATETPAAVVAPRRERRAAQGGESGAPWRQRARPRRETIACTPMRVSTELEDAPEESARRELQDDEQTTDETAASGHVQVTLVDSSVNCRRRQEETESSHGKSAGPQCWEPVFASVFSSSTPQYIMCFNQTNMSFEAQEVSSPTKTPVQPQWRQKAKEAEDEQPEVIAAEEPSEQEASHETKRTLGSSPSDRDVTCYDNSQLTEAAACVYEESPLQPAATELQAAEQEVKEEAPVGESNAPGGDFLSEQSPPPARALPPCRDSAATEGEQDLDVLCQTNTPMLTSAVAEHRRSVRPSRRTQGSRNPLRALAAREDITQDLMGERVAAEERNQAEKQRKNSTTVEDVDVAKSYPPFSSRMLLYIKGRQRVQVRLAEPSARSLNSGDCFLLVTPEHCITWSGEFANEQEKAKALELASLIQSQGDLGCGASQVVHLEEGLNCDSSEATDFWSILGGRSQYRGAGAPEEDELFEHGVVESNCVYRLVENRLVPHEQAWASTPTTALLGPSEALVFDFGSEVYLWHGRDVPPAKRSVALQLTHQVWAGAYDYSNCRVNPLDPTQSQASVQPRGEGRPSWALLGVVPETRETSLFKEKFLDWTSGGEAAKEAAAATDDTQSHPPQPPSPSSPDLLTPCDAKALVSGPEGVDVQRGRGLVSLEEGGQAEVRTLAVDTWHVQEFDDSEVPVESTGQLHEGDSYVIRWTYSTEKTSGADDSSRCSELRENTTFFMWRGRHSCVSGRDTAAFLSIGMSNGQESQVVVPQGKEPPSFLQLFKGGLVVHRGQREASSSDAGEQAPWRLFCVRGELPEEGSLLEVECSCAGLRSRGCVVLVNGQQGALYLWSGCKAHSSSKEVGRRAVERLTQICPPELGLSKSVPVKVQTVEEGSEPAEFWSELGHMDRKAYDCMLQDPGKYNFTPRLFHLSASSGSFKAEELSSPSRLPGVVMAMPFVQESLYSVSEPAVFLLDNRLEVYLWQRGQPAKAEDGAALDGARWQQERRCAMQTALQYCKEMNPRRPPQAYLVEEGSEPLTFTNVFPRWERKVEAHAQDDAGRLKLTLVQDALAQLMKTQYPLEQLLQSPLPEGVDPQHLEVYLSDQDFQAVLEMKRDEYASLPSWQQSDLKRNKGLLC